VTNPDMFTEDELHAYLRDAAPEDLRARIDIALVEQPSLRAEIALMRGLKTTLVSEDVTPLPQELGWQRLKTDISRQQASLPARAPIWRLVAACLGILAVGQAGYIVANAPWQSEDRFETATPEPVEQHILVIAFTPDASADDIIALLGDLGGNIIGGPNTIGMFRVAFESEDNVANAQSTFAQSDLIALTANE